MPTIYYHHSRMGPNKLWYWLSLVLVLMKATAELGRVTAAYLLRWMWERRYDLAGVA